MGNVHFKKRKERTSIIREMIFDEDDNRTSTSINSMLVTNQIFPNSFHPRNSCSQPEIIPFNNELPSIYSYGRHLDIDACIERLLEVASLSKTPKSICFKKSEIIAICQAVQRVFLQQPSFIELDTAVKVMGDIHGQYTDLIRLFQMGGFPPESNYLLLGDYVDRGKQSLETILLLFCYKLKYPENIYLLRGNHESANITRVYGFFDECKRRSNVKVWKTFMDVFNTLPVAALLHNRIFCVHGGISPYLTSLDDIRDIIRPTEVPGSGLINDLLWSDPSDDVDEWEENDRGVSFCFGKKVVDDFLSNFDLDLICRAHMIVEDGYQFFNDKKLVTLFSAPNYCGEFDNCGAIMNVSKDLTCYFQLLKPAGHPLAHEQQIVPMTR